MSLYSLLLSIYSFFSTLCKSSYFEAILAFFLFSNIHQINRSFLFVLFFLPQAVIRIIDTQNHSLNKFYHLCLIQLTCYERKKQVLLWLQRLLFSQSKDFQKSFIGSCNDNPFYSRDFCIEFPS